MLSQRKAGHNDCAPNTDMGITPGMEASMSVFKDLFTSDVGLMSTAVLVITLCMGAFYIRYFLRHIAEDAAAQTKR